MTETKNASPSGPSMTKPSGNCPVQAYGTYRGWLIYFRARDGWTLTAWAPGRWDASKDAADMPIRPEHYWTPDFELSESDENEEIPVWNDQEHAETRGPFTCHENYPGWWSQAYAQAMMNWGLDILCRKIDDAQEPAP